MIKTRRLNEIQEYVLENETVSLDELVTMFNVSKNTIRRDVQELVDSGEFNKVYGGISVNHSITVPFSDRQVRNDKEKEQIAKMAAEYVEDGNIIFIDSGTTTLKMLEYIKNKQVTIITNNIDFIMKAIPYNNLTIFSTGGMLEQKTKSFTSANNKEVIRSYNINKAFLASTGVSIKNGVTNSLPIESEIKAEVVKRSEVAFLLVDHDKFNKSSLTSYCKLNEIDYLVTDMLPEANYIQYAENHHIKLVVS
ncbi:DeoR/GlpR transcriptional regulator [Oceanobacillus zhaokaii]|uniref:DeoR/GlpR transcriptional regulator n=1 Tax=Oceanobacillus zhaokaii TaxID=2052660 RepID=A0A345PKG9_9BACI|nr:DeoR/GlpR family DNA-binding transcription regulator [Oceanobacillus zhaokaii]AXI10499.1 DeoR/GlpR transcriptional regulator [Oceanobacillus zhaokaii]